MGEASARVALKELKLLSVAQRCRTCEVLQGALVQLQGEADDEEMLSEIAGMRVSTGETHSCLRCDSCRPAAVLVKHIRTQR